MAWLRRLWRLPAMIGVLLLGLAILVVLFPGWNVVQRKAMIRRWANWIMTIVGVRVTSSTASNNRSDAMATLEQLPGPFLLAANHISWLDIFVIDSVRPVSFVAKADIVAWPVIGQLCKRAGTIFVERGRRQAVREVLDVMGRELAMGQCVGVFPEGTTSDMKTLLPFHANLLQAAIVQKATILPVALAYVADDDCPDPVVLFVNPVTFAESVIKVLGSKRVSVKLVVCEPIIYAEGLTRHTAAQLCYERISQALGMPGQPPATSGVTASAEH